MVAHVAKISIPHPHITMNEFKYGILDKNVNLITSPTVKSFNVSLNAQVNTIHIAIDMGQLIKYIVIFVGKSIIFFIFFIY